MELLKIAGVFMPRATYISQLMIHAKPDKEVLYGICRKKSDPLAQCDRYPNAGIKFHDVGFLELTDYSWQISMGGYVYKIMKKKHCSPPNIRPVTNWILDRGHSRMHVYHKMHQES
ncbi:unnamed protein product [Cylicostephanus goldi]|uniref:Uncharacterized protein n=1 Tax=Cylicostephanus goldi TaxID=71465 RepID=A0A3P7NL67_CYLGO|nr:unnamed protein product [Cylicostephanus goldi]